MSVNNDIITTQCESDTDTDTDCGIEVNFDLMAIYHDKWYTRVFSNPRIVEELLRSFVHEKFVQELDFSSIRKLNTKFIPVSERSRHADLVFEIEAHGQIAYIYLFIEFQSTVDHFMALRMARYLFEFYQEIQVLTQGELLSPAFPILIYNGDQIWTAPERFSELLSESSVPREYIPQFKYFKIAINEISKRELVKLRNAVSAVFYIENSSAVEIQKNWNALVSVLKEVLEKDGVEIVSAIVDRIFEVHKLSKKSNIVRSIEDLNEVESMLETRTKKWEESVFEKGMEKGIEKGMEKGIEKGIEKLINSGMNDSEISKIFEVSLEKVKKIRSKYKK